MSQLERRLEEFLSRPSTLRDLCRIAGREQEYRRVQQALRRWKKGSGSGVSAEDRQWLRDALEKAEAVW